MFQLSTAQKGCSFQLHEKEYRTIDSAVRAGKILLENQIDGEVVVYSDANHEYEASATKRGWEWFTWK